MDAALQRNQRSKNPQREEPVSWIYVQQHVLGSHDLHVVLAGTCWCCTVCILRECMSIYACVFGCPSMYWWPTYRSLVSMNLLVRMSQYMHRPACVCVAGRRSLYVPSDGTSPYGCMCILCLLKRVTTVERVNIVPSVICSTCFP